MGSGVVLADFRGGFGLFLVAADLQSWCAVGPLERGVFKVLKGSQITVFAVAAICWSAYFYAMDMAIMEGQGLPVSSTLMPK